MVIALDKNTKDLADATGFIVDRTLTPEKIIGQAWLISKSRVLVKASAVSLYSEAPWSLVVRFPYPNLSYYVKTISLHPDFNKRQIRDSYLNQATEGDWTARVYSNDIATLTLDTETPEFAPERIHELNRALSLPINISADELSGAVRPGDAGSILHNALVSGRAGSLNFYDERNVPFARILIRQGRILRALFKSLINEYAVCELLSQKLAGNFVLHASDNFAWPNIPEITTSTEQLMNEANRRGTELPKLAGALAGAEARYALLSANIDLNQFPPQNRWIKERLLAALDGFMPAGKIGERIGVDTYTAMQGLWELRKQSFIGMTSEDAFHGSGQLGPQLIPGGDIDLNIWDEIAAFYLDELSGAPVVLAGNYVAPGSLLSPKALLHNIPMRTANHGAAMIKNGRLVGIHCGRFMGKSPMELGQMSWVGSLTDMGPKRLRSTAEAVLELPETELPGSAGKALPPPPRFRNQAEVEAPPSETLPPIKRSNEPAFLQKFSKLHVFIAGCAMFVLGLLMLINGLLFPSKQIVYAPVAKTASPVEKKNNSPSVKRAIEIATTLGEFKDANCPPYEFEDTSVSTDPKPSFGLLSKQQNQRILCVLWPNQSAADTVASVESQLPFWNYKKAEEPTLIETGEAGRITWAARHFLNKDDKDTVILIGAYPSSQPNQCMLVLAQPYKNEGILDFHTTLGVMQRMVGQGTGKPEGESPQP